MYPLSHPEISQKYPKYQKICLFTAGHHHYFVTHHHLLVHLLDKHYHLSTGDTMKIQLGKNIIEPITKDQLIHAEIVESDGSYILYAQNTKFPVYDSRRKSYVNLQDIFIVSVIDQNTVVETEHESFHTTLPLKDFEVEPLLRINRTTIVNPHFIEDIKVSLNMKYNIRIHNQWHDVNRSYYYEFKKTIGI